MLYQNVQDLQKKKYYGILNPEHLCGRAPKQVEDFIKNKVEPILEKYKELAKDISVEVKV